MATCSRASSREGDEDQDWSDWEAESANEPTQCLLSSAQARNVRESLAIDKERHGFDLLQIVKERKLDFYGAIKLVNFIRRLRQDDVPVDKVIARVHDDSSPFLDPEDESYLQPVLQDDPLLCALGELLDVSGEEDDDFHEHEEAEEYKGRHHSGNGQTAMFGAARVECDAVDGFAGEDDDEQGYGKMQEGGGEDVTLKGSLEAQNQALKLEVADLRSRVARMSELLAEMDKDVQVPRPQEDNDSYYFASYAHHGIHEEMLRDDVRTGSYAKAMAASAEFIKGKTVLDVGCGTGVLSMFAAKAGAAKVVGVDMSDIIERAREIVKLNGLEDVVTLVKGKMEEVELPVDKVDVIVSEWMGYALLFESMLPSVLHARDKLLKQGGLMIPSQCSMIIQGMTDSEGRLAWWDDVHGLSMAPIRDLVMTEPSVEVVDSASMVTHECVFRRLDLTTIKDEDLDFKAPFRMAMSRRATLNGLVVWFDTQSDAPNGSEPVQFSTGPAAKPTHWKQALFWVNDMLKEELTEGDEVRGTITFRRNLKNHRSYDISIQWELVLKGQLVAYAKGEQLYVLGS